MDHAAFGTNQEFVEQGAEQLDRRDPLKIGKCDVPLDFSLQQELHQQHAGEVRALQAELDCIVDSLDNFKCCVCFNVYDEGAHTPRSLSCGQDTHFDEDKHCCNSFCFHFLSRICFACNHAYLQALHMPHLRRRHAQGRGSPCPLMSCLSRVHSSSTRTRFLA